VLECQSNREEEERVRESVCVSESNRDKERERESLIEKRERGKEERLREKIYLLVVFLDLKCTKNVLDRYWNISFYWKEIGHYLTRLDRKRLRYEHHIRAKERIQSILDTRVCVCVFARICL